MRMSVRVKVAIVSVSVLVAVLGFSLVRGDSPDALTREDLMEICWLRQFEASSRAFDGFYLKDDGRLLFINIFSMTGDHWALEGDHLILSSHTGRYPEPFPVDYAVRKEGERIILSASGGSEAIAYKAEEGMTDPGGKRWVPFYVENPEGFVLPEDTVPFLEFDMEEKMVRGFGGVNRFQGAFEMSGKSGLTIGSLATTRMAGPGMEYEGLFLSVLGRADTVLTVRGMLFLYRGTTIVGAFRMAGE